MMGKRFSFTSACKASILATLALILSMALFGIDITKSLGYTAGRSGFEAYVLGTLLSFCAGSVYGMIYALFFEPALQSFPKFVKGFIFSFLPFLLSILFLETFLEWLRFLFPPQPYQGYANLIEIPGEGSKGWSIDLINHQVYGITLALFYRPKK